MARTAIAGVQDAIAKKESKINALGIKTRDQDGERRDFIEVVMDVMQKTGAKGKAYTQIFDPAKSGKAIATMETAFNAAGGGKTGRAAMEKLLSGDDSLKDATVAEMQKDAAHRMDDAGTRIRKSVETFRQALSDKLAPAIERFAAEAPKIAEWLSKGIDWITKNPALAAGAVVGFGAVKGGAGAFAGAGLRFAGDTLANKVPGFGAAGGVMSSVGGLVTKAGSTPVYVTGAAPGAFGGGTGGPGGGDSGAGAAALAAAIGLAVGAAIGKVIKDTEEQKKKLLEEGEEWKRTHPNAGPGMKVKPGTGGLSEDDEYMRRRYGPGATNPDAEDPNSILSREALASPFADPTDYTKKHVDSAAANSPYASIEDYLWDKVGTGTFRFDENPNVNKSGTAMPVKAGDAGFGVLAPQPTGVPQATAAVAESEKLAKALAEVTRQLERFKNTQSAFK
ncbi:MAG: hypothetical protein HYV09_35880 [Deltaproteobacteria bacterium]|nr:hypothetical protein [Deltaproteobacteria bacterium]